MRVSLDELHRAPVEQLPPRKITESGHFKAQAFDACYDRGGLVALPPEVRPRYVQHTRSLLTRDAYQLLITLEYDQSVVAGPPYAVAADEVRRYFPGFERIDVHEDPNVPPKFREAGLNSVAEVVWRSS